MHMILNYFFLLNSIILLTIVLLLKMNSMPQAKSWITPQNSQQSQRSSSRGSRSRYTIAYEAYYKKVRGILQVELKQNKRITWTPIENTRNDITRFIIGGENISTEVASMGNKGKELIMITDKGTGSKYVFAFKGNDNEKKRNLFSNLLTKSADESYKIEYNSVSTLEKKKIMLLIRDDYLKILFDEIVSKRGLFQLEEFWVLVKKMYPEKITFSFVDNLIQSSRSDELDMEFRPLINYEIKNRILNSYDNVKKLYEFYKEKKMKEESFWKEFMNNQNKNKTEIVGGMKSVSFTCDDEQNIKSMTITQSSHLDKYYNKVKYDKTFENVEKHSNYIDNYEGRCITVPETDYTEKKISEKAEELNRTISANIISSLNNYSSRKIEKLNYLPNLKRKLICNSNSNKLSFTTSKTIDDDDDIQMISATSTKKITNISARLAEMERTQRTNTPQSFDSTFSKINENFNDITKKKNLSDPPSTKLPYTTILLNLGNLVRDLVYLYKIYRNSNNTGRDEIKTLLRDIKAKVGAIMNDSSLLPYQALAARAIWEIGKQNRPSSSSNSTISN